MAWDLLVYLRTGPNASFMLDAMTECGARQCTHQISRRLRVDLRTGPWHALRLKKGDDFVDGLRDDFLAPYAVDAPLVHDPTARVLVFRRKS